MQQAIPYNSGRAWAPHSLTSSSPSCSTISTNNSSVDNSDNLKRLIAENPVLVLGKRGCCMCHVVKRLLLGLGVNPSVCEVGDEIDEMVLMEELTTGEQKQMFFPAVFIGGRLVGGLDRLMALHISGDLVPILKDAGALWL